MKSNGKRYSDEQVVGILREAESGRPVAQICRQYQVSEVTVYCWRSKYRGMDKAMERIFDLNFTRGYS